MIKVIDVSKFKMEFISTPWQYSEVDNHEKNVKEDVKFELVKVQWGSDARAKKLM